MRLNPLFALLAATFFVAPALHAQTSAPLHETRAVWVTTVYRLDWPPFDPNVSPTLLRQVQQDALDRIVDRSAERGLNTLFFQVFFHGTAAYPSQRVPWSNYIAGEAGKDPGWDPLEYVIEKAHARGMEVHAWFNVYQMGNPSSEVSETAEPLHVRVANPDWVKPYYVGATTEVRDYWLNPADPDARAWLVGNVEEIIDNYDVDGIHFDYMRYPGYGLPGDADGMVEWPNGQTTIDNWRRENVNMFVRDAYAATKAIKPWVKVGSAPIGTRRYYTNAPPGFWAWDHLYQDARQWLIEGVQDYVAPQLYHDIGTEATSHDFAFWLDHWLAISRGRHIYAGLATYRENDPNEKIFKAGEIARQIALAREEGADGQSHFRYRHTESSPFGGHYAPLALPAVMDYLDEAAAPDVPADVDVSGEGSTYTVTWSFGAAAETDPLRRFAVMRGIGGPPSRTTGEDIVAILGPDDRSFTETLTLGEGEHPYYRVVSQSLLGMTAFSEVSTTDPNPVSAEVNRGLAGAGIVDVYPNPSSSRVTIGFDAPTYGSVTLRVVDMMGRVVQVHEEMVAAGRTEVALSVDGLASGSYLVQSDFNGARSSARLVVVR